MCHSPPPLHPLHPLHLHHFRLVCFSNFWINGEALHPTGLCLIWFGATIFSLDPVLPCSVTFGTLMSRQLQLIILLFRRRLMSSGGAGFYSSVFVVPKHTGGLCSILNLKCFNRFMHIPSFKMPTLKNVQQLIQQGDYAFSIDLQDAYLRVAIVKHHRWFLHFVWHNVPYQWRVLPFGLATTPRVFTSLTKPILFLCHHKGLHIVIYLDDILVLVCSKQAGKRAHLFLCSLLVRLGLHINFSKSDLHLSQSFTFLGFCWDTVCMLVSLTLDKLAEIQQLALALLRTPHVTVHKVISFLGKANFCTNGHSQLRHLCCVIQTDMLSFYHSPTQ